MSQEPQLNAPPPDLVIEEFPSGTIGIPCGEMIRSPGFVHALATTVTPPNSRINLMIGMNVVENLNTIVRNMAGDWVHFQADDHVWGSWDLLKSLKAMYDNDLDVVVPLMTRRSPPFTPLIFKSREVDGWMPYPWHELPQTGLFPVYAAGTGGMIVRKRALDRLVEAQGHDRFFEYEAGEILNEDLVFCERLKALDPPVEIWCNVDLKIGHRMMVTSWPAQDAEGAWGVAFDMGATKDGHRSTIFVTGDRTLEDDESMEEIAADTSG